MARTLYTAWTFNGTHQPRPKGHRAAASLCELVDKTASGLIRSTLISRSGAIPVLDWLAGHSLQWEDFKLHSYQPALPEKVYSKLLERLTQTSGEWWRSSMSGLLPTWVVPTGQLFEGSACEKRKELVEQHGGRMTVTYKPQPGYVELFHAFENNFILDGQIRSLMSPPALERAALMPKSQPSGLPGPKYGGITMCFKGRYFKTLNDYCEQFGHTNSFRGPRSRLINYKFPATDTQWFARGSAKT